MLREATQPKIDKTQPLEISGKHLNLETYSKVARGRTNVRISNDPQLLQKLNRSVEVVSNAVRDRQVVYGVTTGFGGMAGQTVPCEQATALQNNLLSFLACGAGDPIESIHVRGAMLLRANVLLKGLSGIRPEIIKRLIQFLNADAIPVVRELGSIGASGDLVPLGVVARAITGHSDHVRVRMGNQELNGNQALGQIGLEPISLQAKEGLALVNGTSFSAAIAANSVVEAKNQLAISLTIQSMFLRSLLVLESPFEPFVHACKPHPGQVWTAEIMKRLLTEGYDRIENDSTVVQDRYSLRCLPQYLGSVVEGISQIQSIVEVEMNGVSDNPLVDPAQETFYQSGNFLGQYLSIAMDDLRKHLGLVAKHLDVQVASLVTPEFNGGLGSSLRGNPDVSFNMGLKGLQICGNSIMPLLTYLGNPLCQHFPTHAEQYNQNVNGLSWGSANMAWKSIQLFRQYLSVMCIFAVQALDLRAHQLFNHFDGQVLLGDLNRPLYRSICQTLGCEPGGSRPLVFDDSDRWLEQDIANLADQLGVSGNLAETMHPIIESFEQRFGESK